MTDVNDSLPKSRKKALEVGSKYYFTGKPCSRGHVCKRYASAGICCECASEQQKENKARVRCNYKKWYYKNRTRARQLEHSSRLRRREEAVLYNRNWRSKNREKIRQSSRLSYAKNKEQYKLTTRKWQRKNKQRVCQYSRLYATMKYNAQPFWADQEQLDRVYKKRDELNAMWQMDFEVDHIVPLRSNTVCGLHVPDNLQLLCKLENVRKGNRYNRDF